MSVYQLLYDSLINIFNGCPIWGIDYIVPIVTIVIILAVLFGIILIFWKLIRIFTNGGNKRKW